MGAVWPEVELVLVLPMAGWLDARGGAIRVDAKLGRDEKMIEKVGYSYMNIIYQGLHTRDKKREAVEDGRRGKSEWAWLSLG